MLTRAGSVLAIAAGLVLVSSCGDGDGGDQASFCDAVEALAANDPFAELAVASPQEMRTAFDQLRDGAERIEDSAPDEFDTQADRYLRSVDGLIDQLRGAGYDPRALDTLDYREATSEYEAAAISVENAAAGACT